MIRDEFGEPASRARRTVRRSFSSAPEQCGMLADANVRNPG